MAEPRIAPEEGVVQRYFKCPLNGVLITKEQCQALCSSPRQNRELCIERHHCESPWHFCLACQVQNVHGDDTIVVNPETGLCYFHEKNGPDARRGDAPKKMLSLSSLVGSSSLHTRERAVAHPPRTEAKIARSSVEPILRSVPPVRPSPKPPIAPPVQREAVVARSVATVEDESEISSGLVEEYKRRSLVDRARLFQRLRRTHPRKRAEDIAHAFEVSSVTVWSYINLVERVDPRVLDFMDPTKTGNAKPLGLGVGLSLMPLSDSPETQFAIAKELVARQLNHSQALQFVGQKIAELGAPKHKIRFTGGQGRPYEYFSNLARILEKLESYTERFRRERETRWKDHLSSKTERERQSLLKQIRATQRALDEICAEIQ